MKNGTFPGPSQETGLRRELSAWDATSIIVGVIIGAGIFMEIPSEVAGRLPSAPWILFAWILGGLLTLIGALCYAELSASIPRTGGDYAYLKAAYGKTVAFLYGWSKFVIVQTGNIALLALFFGSHVARVFPVQEEGGLLGGADLDTALALLAIIGLTSVNILGLKLGRDVQNLVTFVKLIALGALIVVPLLLGKGDSTRLAASSQFKMSWQALAAFATAMVSVLWAYGGWSESVLVAGEVQNPSRNLPRSIIGSAVLCMVLYVLVNVSYLSVLGVREMIPATVSRESTETVTPEGSGLFPPPPESPPGVAEKVIARAGGRLSRELVSLLVAVSVFGALNGLILTGARVAYATGRDHPLFAWLGKPSEKYSTPAMALTVQAVWSAGMVLLFRGRVLEMIFYMGSAVWLFYALAGLSLLVLRKRYPNANRPFKVWGYPVIPIIFVLQSFAMMAASFWSFKVGSLYSLSLILLGFLLYLAIPSESWSPPGGEESGRNME